MNYNPTGFQNIPNTGMRNPQNPMDNVTNYFTPMAQKPNGVPAQMPCRMINSLDEVFPNEVPDDGRWGVFITKDLSHVYLLTWNLNGRIDQLEFTPNTQGLNQTQMSMEEMINSRFDALEKRIDKLAYKPNKPKRKPITKEVTDNV